MGPEGLLPWVQEPRYGPCCDPNEPIAHHCTLFAYILVLFFIKYFHQNDTFPSGLKTSNLCAFITSLLHATWPANIVHIIH